MAENRTMKEKPALCIQGMARKFVRESIIEDAATRLIVQIMTEVADAHIAPRDAEIASLRAQLDEAKATSATTLKQLGRALEHIDNMSASETMPDPTYDDSCDRARSFARYMRERHPELARALDGDSE